MGEGGGLPAVATPYGGSEVSELLINWLIDEFMAMKKWEMTAIDKKKENEL